MQNKGEVLEDLNPQPQKPKRSSGEEVNQSGIINNQDNSNPIARQVFSALETYANKCQLEKNPNFKTSNCYLSNPAELKKDRVQLKYQIISQLTILKYSFKMDTNTNLSDSININQEIERLKTWSTWVPDEDKKYYAAAMELLYGRDSQTFEKELEIAKNENKNKEEVHYEEAQSKFIPKQQNKPKRNVGEEVEDPNQPNFGGIPGLSEDALERLRERPREIEERAGGNQYISPEERQRQNNKQELRDLIDSFFDQTITNLESLNLYLPSDAEAAEHLCDFFENSIILEESLDQYLGSYKLYLYKDNKDTTSSKVRSFITTCNSLIERGYDADFFSRINVLLESLIF